MYRYSAAKFLPTVLLFLGLTSVQAEPNEGFEYQVIDPPVATETGDKIEVLELFWYGCPHCYRLEPYVNQWLPTIPDNAEFRRMPAIFSDRWALHARAYYTAETLGVLDEIHEPLFRAMHEEQKRLNSEEALAKFFAEHGVSKEQFTQTFNSFFIDSKVRRAKALTKAYGIDGVPALIVDGKYRTSGTLAGGQEQVMTVVDHLIERETAARAGTAAPAE